MDSKGLKKIAKKRWGDYEKLKEFFDSIFTAENVQKLLILLGRKLEEVSQIEVRRKKVIGLMDAFIGLDDIHPRVLNSHVMVSFLTKKQLVFSLTRSSFSSLFVL